MDQSNTSQNSYATSFTTTPKQMEHQKAMAQENHEYQLKLQKAQHDHEIKLKNKELGIIGRLFGASENASKNITALICLTLIIGALYASFEIYDNTSDNKFIERIWQIVIPVVTLSLGYIFGKKD